MKKILSVITLTCLFGLSSCNSTQSSITSSNSTSSEDKPSINQENSTTSINNSNALVIYFSATNNTERVANTIADYIKSPIYKLEPTNPYTSADLNYSNQDSRVVLEHSTIQNGEKVNVELATTSFDEFENAKYIFLGAPVWWQQLSWVIEGFVSNNDFSNKTIIPFGTSVSSSFNLDNLTPLTSDDSNVTWMSPQRFSSSVNSSTVTSWIDSLNLD